MLVQPGAAARPPDDQHQHGRRAGLDHRPGELLLHPGEVERGAVAALAARAVVGQPGPVPQHQDGDVRPGGESHGLLEPVAGLAGHLAALGERQPLAEPLPQRASHRRRLQGGHLEAVLGDRHLEHVAPAAGHLEQRLDVRGIRVVAEQVARRVGVRADQRHRPLRRQRQRAVVAQEDQALAGDRPGQRALGGVGRGGRGPLRLDERPLEQPELDLGRRTRRTASSRMSSPSEPRLERGQQRRAVAVGVRQLDVQSGGEGHRGRLLGARREAVVLGQLAHREVVRDHHAVEAPLLPQELGQEPAVAAARHPVELVVGVHERAQPGRAHDGLERVQVDLAELARAEVHRRPVHPALRRAVAHEVLRGGHHAVARSSPCRPRTNAVPIRATR